MDTLEPTKVSRLSSSPDYCIALIVQTLDNTYIPLHITGYQLQVLNQVVTNTPDDKLANEISVYWEEWPCGLTFSCS